MLPQIIFFVLFVCSTNATKAPFITKCKLDDKQCLKQSMAKAIPFFADGLPDLKVEQLDPMKIAYVDATTANLKFLLRHITIIGLKNCEAEKLSIDVPKTKMNLKVLCTVNLDAQYELNGQLLLLTIEGKGNVHATLNKILISAEVNINEFNDADGKKHWSIKSYKYNYNLKEKSVVKFENLFPNSEFLRNTTNNLIDMNSNEVVYELGPAIVEAVVAKALKNIENFFGVLPLEDLTLE